MHETGFIIAELTSPYVLHAQCLNISAIGKNFRDSERKKINLATLERIQHQLPVKRFYRRRAAEGVDVPCTTHFNDSLTVHPDV